MVSQKSIKTFKIISNFCQIQLMLTQQTFMMESQQLISNLTNYYISHFIINP